MKFHAGDRLEISYGGEIKLVTVANGLDNIQNSDERLKVIFDGDSSYNPITINTKNIRGKHDN